MLEDVSKYSVIRIKVNFKSIRDNVSQYCITLMEVSVSAILDNVMQIFCYSDWGECLVTIPGEVIKYYAILIEVSV